MSGSWATRRAVAAGLVFLATTVSSAAAPPPPAAGEQDAATGACRSEALLGESRQYTCTLPATAAPRRLRFRADFGGGHDDSMASMTVALDDAPVACADGSRLQLEGEFGDVYIDCILALPPSAAPRRLGVTLRWRHAQYTRAGLLAE